MRMFHGTPDGRGSSASDYKSSPDCHDESTRRGSRGYRPTDYTYRIQCLSCLAKPGKSNDRKGDPYSNDKRHIRAHGNASGKFSSLSMITIRRDYRGNRRSNVPNACRRTLSPHVARSNNWTLRRIRKNPRSIWNRQTVKIHRRIRM